jgi:hypothetical protein
MLIFDWTRGPIPSAGRAEERLAARGYDSQATTLEGSWTLAEVLTLNDEVLLEHGSVSLKEG